MKREVLLSSIWNLPSEIIKPIRVAILFYVRQDLTFYQIRTLKFKMLFVKLD